MKKIQSLLPSYRHGPTNSLSCATLSAPIKPVADMICLVQSTYSAVEDLDLVWELLERIWCFGHPVFRYQTSQDLDILCERISKRKIEVDNALRIHPIPYPR